MSLICIYLSFLEVPLDRGPLVLPSVQEHHLRLVAQHLPSILAGLVSPVVPFFREDLVDPAHPEVLLLQELRQFPVDNVSMWIEGERRHTAMVNSKRTQSLYFILSLSLSLTPFSLFCSPPPIRPIYTSPPYLTSPPPPPTLINFTNVSVS